MPIRLNLPGLQPRVREGAGYVTKLFLKRLLGDRSGATAIEYGLILALVVLAMMGALNAFAGESELTWNNVAQKTRDAISGA